MIDDVIEGFARLQPLTGLTFVETSSASDANIFLRWGDLAAERSDDGATADAQVQGIGRGRIRFDKFVSANGNDRAGWGLVQVYYTFPDGERVPWFVQTGRQMTVVHEIMHVLGFDHVEDFTSIMYAGWVTNGQGDFSAGDLAGLRTMYLDQPCTPQSPVSPSQQEAATTSGNDEQITSDSLVLRRVWRGSKVIKATVINGRMSAMVKTKLSPGTPVVLKIGNYDEDLGKWVEEFERLRVGKNGVVRIDTAIAKDDEVVLAKANLAYLARWVVSNRL